MIINPSWAPSQALRYITENSVRSLNVRQRRCPTPCLEIIPPYCPDHGCQPEGFVFPAQCKPLQHQTQTCLPQSPSPPAAHGSPWAGTSLPLSCLARNHHLRSAFLACCAVFLPLCTKYKCKGVPTYMFGCLYTRLRVQAVSFSFS